MTRSMVQSAPFPTGKAKPEQFVDTLLDPLGQQHRITQPAQVVHGTAGQAVDPGNAGVLAGLLPNTSVARS